MDTDKDGLTDSREAELGTNPNKPDTDGDGLADGDEANVYHSDPLLPDTDSDDYDDGREVARGYSPIVKSTEKADNTEQKNWVDRIGQYGLHEPTLSTLKLKAHLPATSESAMYTNTVYDYSFDLPKIFALREKQDKSIVGIAVVSASATSTDEDLLSDPISLTVGSKVAGQTLSDWAKGQYQLPAGALIVVPGNPLKPVQFKQISAGEGCDPTRTVFGKGDKVVVLTLTCTDEFKDFRPYYDQMTASFKFTK